jgi:hypothetical protein
MSRPRRQEHASAVALIFGLIFFPTLQAASLLFLEEGVFTILFRRSLGLPRLESATTTPETAPGPDRTRPLAVMIDNHPDAFPQSGVARADAVWEALVEGGLTRLMLVYRSATASEIGPVRSARPYFLRWARESDAVFAHVGGSDEALSELSSGSLGLTDANEFREVASFWRDRSRKAPHNTYTSTDRLRSLLSERGWATETEAVDASLRADLFPEGPPAESLSVRFAQGGHVERFRYDPETESYVRIRDGRALRDRGGEVVAPRTVVVLEIGAVKAKDPQGKGLIGIETTGEGPATVFRGGQAIAGRWKKASAAEPTHVYDEAGAKIPFASGQVWFAVVAPNRGGEVAFSPREESAATALQE